MQLKPKKSEKHGLKRELEKNWRVLSAEERTEERREFILEQLKVLVENNVLASDFLLYPQDKDPVTAGAVLENIDEWHEMRFADPVEPDYRNDSRIAYANLKGDGEPYIYSHAHGGRRFFFEEKPVVMILAGQRSRYIQKVLAAMRKRFSLYDHGGELVEVQNDEMLPMTKKRLLHRMDIAVETRRYDRRRKKFAICDAPSDVAETILESNEALGCTSNYVYCHGSVSQS